MSAAIDACDDADTPVDAVVFSDFRHGIFNRRTIPPSSRRSRTACYRVADSQVASRWGNILDFQGFDLITPNEREARFALGDQDSGFGRSRPSSTTRRTARSHPQARRPRRADLPRRKHEPHDSFFVVDSFVDRLVDAVGAGDALLAYATLAMLADENPTSLRPILGSMAAACECEHDGNIPVTPETCARRSTSSEKQARLLSYADRDAGRSLPGSASRVTSDARCGHRFRRVGRSGQRRGRLQDPARCAARPLRRRRSPAFRTSRRSSSFATCSSNGKHVLVEKPLWAARDEDIAELERAAARNGVVATPPTTIASSRISCACAI